MIISTILLAALCALSNYKDSFDPKNFVECVKKDPEYQYSVKRGEAEEAILIAQYEYFKMCNFANPFTDIPCEENAKIVGQMLYEDFLSSIFFQRSK